MMKWGTQKQRLSRYRRYKGRNRGFVIPLVMGMGLLMLLVAVTMMLRSQTQVTTASAQKASERSIAIAETGLERVRDYLSRNRGLLNQNFDPSAATPLKWAGDSSSFLDQRFCNGSHPEYQEADAFNEPIEVEGGRYQVVSYLPTPSSEGCSATNRCLTIKGEALDGNEVRSATQIRAHVPVSRNVVPASTPPVLWAENYTWPGTGTQVLSTASHEIVEAKCGTIGSLVGSGNRIAAGTVISSPTRPLPPPLSLPSGAINLGSYSAPTNATTIFPRAADIALYPSGNGSVPNEYVYRAASITVTSTGAIVVPAGSKVTFFIDNNISTTVGTGSGNRRPKIGHDCTDANNDGISDGTTIINGCSPGDLKLIGMNTTSGTFAIANNNNSTPSTTTEAVIIAPNYTVTIGQASFTTRFKGVIWSRNINLSQGTTTIEPVNVPWSVLQPTVPPLSPPGSVLPLSMDSIRKLERVSVQ